MRKILLATILISMISSPLSAGSAARTFVLVSAFTVAGLGGFGAVAGHFWGSSSVSNSCCDLLTSCPANHANATVPVTTATICWGTYNPKSCDQYRSGCQAERNAKAGLIAAGAGIGAGLGVLAVTVAGLIHVGRMPIQPAGYQPVFTNEISQAMSINADR